MCVFVLVRSLVLWVVMKNLDPPENGPPGPDIWTRPPMELIFQELDEILTPNEIFEPPLPRVNKLFLKFKTILKAKIVKTQCYILCTQNYHKTKLLVR